MIEQDLSMRTEMTSCLSIAVLSVVVAAAPPTLSNLTWPLFHAVSKPFKSTALQCTIRSRSHREIALWLKRDCLLRLCPSRRVGRSGDIARTSRVLQGLTLLTLLAGNSE